MERILVEKKFLLSVLLLAVAEQVPQFVRIKHRSSDRDYRARLRIAQAAREFVQSKEFTDMAEVAGFPASVLRSQSPASAYAAYMRIADEQYIEDTYE